MTPLLYVLKTISCTEVLKQRVRKCFPTTICQQRQRTIAYGASHLPNAFL